MRVTQWMFCIRQVAYTCSDMKIYLFQHIDILYKILYSIYLDMHSFQQNFSAIYQVGVQTSKINPNVYSITLQESFQLQQCSYG